MDSRYRFNRVDKKGYGLQLVVCDGGAFKDSIAVRLQKENGPGSFMVFKDCDENYANQLSSEQKVMVKTSAGNVMRWVPKRSHIDNHYLDCEVYAMCAAEILGVRNLREEGYEETSEDNTKAEDTESDWITGGNKGGWL